MISPQQIDDVLESYGFPQRAGLAEKVIVYIDLLMKWNDKISLTTVTDPLEIARFHFGESLFGASKVEMDESRLADVGTGAGFPGLPLAMAIPKLQVTLIESNTKKCAFLAEVIRRLSISNARVLQGRMESVDGERFDFVTARALGHFDDLLTWSGMHLGARGRLLLWLGAEDAGDLSVRAGWHWQSPIRIPGSSRRVLLIGEPVRE